VRTGRQPRTGSGLTQLAAALVAALSLGLAGCGGGSHTTAAHGPVERTGGGPALGSLAISGAGHRFYEIYDPVGPARGTMLMLHGGGWKDQRGNARSALTVASLAFRANGWRVVNVSYSPGPPAPGHSLDPFPMMRDVVAFYDQIHRAFTGPICAYGESAGAHLAAMLAIERPSLTCAIISAAPLDLLPLLKLTSPVGVGFIRSTFGTRRSVLAAWSPALLWRRGIDRTAVFATDASNDTVVPPEQLRAFEAADPAVDGTVVSGASAGSSDAVPWMHSDVSRTAIDARLEALDSWLNRIVPSRSEASVAAATSVGSDCDTIPAAGPARWRLLLSGDAWRQSATPGQLIAATRGCSGAAYWQDDGMSLWALPATSPGQTLPDGSDAALTLTSSRALHRISASFRGFLGRPADWDLGLLANGHQIAGCDAGHCSGFRLDTTDAGGLLAAGNSPGDPDTSNAAPSETFKLPAGTRTVSWQLRCVAPAGCATAAAVNASGESLRSRDPLGQPAIFSLYRVDVS
jgi:hypothetical protein